MRRHYTYSMAFHYLNFLFFTYYFWPQTTWGKIKEHQNLSVSIILNEPFLIFLGKKKKMKSTNESKQNETLEHQTIGLF